MNQDLPRALSHVYWMGGSPCSGKSSIVRLLAERYGFTRYHCDDHFDIHQQRAHPEKQPALYRLGQMTWDEIWQRPVAVQVTSQIAIYREQFSMILDDLLALPDTSPVVAEGAALLPEVVANCLRHRRQAIWVVPVEAFQREIYPQRGEWIQDVLRQCTYPTQAFQNWMDRDVAFARWVTEQARELNLRAIEVDGARSLDENASLIAAHFGFASQHS